MSDADADLDPVRLVALLSARLCHDLITPVTAVTNGIELMEDADALGPEIAQEATQLIALSGARAAAALVFFRAAYGTGAGGTPSSGAILKLAADHLSAKGLRVEAPDPGLVDAFAARLSDDPATGMRMAAKPLLNLFLCVSQCLPRDGTVRLEPPTEGAIVQIAAAGPGAAVKADLAQAIAGDAAPESLDPKAAQGYFLGHIAKGLGLRPETGSDGPDRIVMRLKPD